MRVTTLFSRVIPTALLMGLMGSAASGQDIYVDDDAPGDPGAYSPLLSDPLEDGSAAHPFDAIAEAINAAQDGDEILVLQGVYQGVGNRDLDFAGKSITLRGTGSPYLTVINAQSAGRVLLFQSGETSAARVEGLILANGKAPQGGGIYISAGSSPSIVKCVITWNNADQGGGVYLDSGSAVIKNCLITANEASSQGGGLHVAGTASPQVSGCTFTVNEAPFGGAIHAAGSGSVWLRNSILWFDTAFDGLEIHLDQSSALLVDYCDVRGGQSAVSLNGASVLIWGTGNLDADPLFVKPVFYNYHLGLGSPCVDAADPAYVPRAGENDFDEEPRVWGAAMDMGVDEINCGVGTGEDCNANGIPDECEPDCNGNGIPDDCDIVSNPSSDVNGDKILDECAPWIQTWVDDDAFFDPGPGDPTISDPLEEGSSQHPFDTIQEGLDAAMSFDFVVVRPGTYRGVGNRDIDFRGKANNLTGVLGPSGVTIDAEGLGRGFYLHSGEPHMAHIDGFTIVNGSATRGGGIYTTKNSNVAIVECIFLGNTAQWGGAIAFEGYGETLRNCILVSNTASIAGGGIYCAGNADPFIRGCTIVANSTPGEGGGIAVVDADNVRLRSSIVWGNSATSGAQIHLDQQAELLVSYTDLQGGQASVPTSGGSSLVWGSGNIDLDPEFRDPAGGDYHITLGSPCIDGGFPPFTLQPGETDIDRDPRIAGELKDIGADEIVCQEDIGYAGPGNVTLKICGDDLTKPESSAMLLLEGAAPDAQVFLFAGLNENPTMFFGGTLVPYPWLMLLDTLSTDGAGTLSLAIPGGLGPFVLYVQAVVPSGTVYEFSNALELVE